MKRWRTMIVAGLPAWGRELTRPANYLAAGIAGLVFYLFPFNAGGGLAVLVGMVFGMLTIARATFELHHRPLVLLAQLPAQRMDPSFVMDRDGTIVLSAGETKTFFAEHRIDTLFDLFEPEDAREVIAAAVKRQTPQERICYAALVRKWYRVRVKPLPRGSELLVWLVDVTDQKMADLSLAVIRGFSNEIMGSMDQLVKNNDSALRLCRLIFQEGYASVFITRENAQGDLAGHVCRADGGQVCLSEPITIQASSPAPIWKAKRSQRVETATRGAKESQADFERRHPFDERVKSFVGAPITNYVNYHEGGLFIIAYNKRSPITVYDQGVMETLGNTAHAITRLIDLALESDEKFIQIIAGLCATAEYSDELTGKHILRVNAYARLLARQMDQSTTFIDQIGKVAALHDIGKVAIPEIVKLKRGLDAKELAEMRMHTVYGAQIIDKMISMSRQAEPRLEMARAIALNHHQRWDGAGYPGLIDEDDHWDRLKGKSHDDYHALRPPKGEEIPLAALIVSLADKYDALRSSRSYKTELSHQQACDLLARDDRDGSRGEALFGEQLFGVFKQNHAELDRIYTAMRDG